MFKKNKECLKKTSIQGWQVTHETPRNEFWPPQNTYDLPIHGHTLMLIHKNKHTDENIKSL